jgi:hypothetical protein
MTNDEDWEDIDITSALSLGTAGALMTAIGTMWPEAKIVTGGCGLHMQIPKKPSKALDEEFLSHFREERENSDTADDTKFLGFRDGWIAFAPPEQLCLHLGEVVHSILSANPEAVNHLEWEVRVGREPGDPSYVLSASRSKGQTPLAMRKAAEAEVERLRAILEKNGIDPDE